METSYAFVGVTGLGKTYNVFHQLKANKRFPLLVRSLEDLCLLTQKHTDIVFDDISFENKRPELLITLCDKDFHSSVRILKRSVVIPPGVTKWFTHNDADAFQPVLASWRQQQAIDRRLTVVKLETREGLLNILQQLLRSPSSTLLTQWRSSLQQQTPQERDCSLSPMRQSPPRSQRNTQDGLTAQR